MKILIDNGHGITTKGKRSPDGSLLEYKYTREIAKKVVGHLCAHGLDAELLVPEDADISLGERCSRANAWCSRLGSGNVLLVSIHVNAAGDGSSWKSATGWEAYTSPGLTKADSLADCLYAAAETTLAGILGADTPLKVRTDLSDGDPDKEARFQILTGTRCPAVLTENFFMDNRADCSWLLSAEGRRAVTRIHVSGIIQYISHLKK